MGATIKDIAEKTGLGLATISKYLNGGHVLDKNREAIEEAIRELNFTVNEFARGLKTNQSRTIGVVIPQLNNLFMTSVITNIEEVLRQNGYAVIVSDTGKSAKREVEVLQFLMNKKVDGIILLTSGYDGAGLEAVLRHHIPVVLIDRKIDRLAGIVDMVLVDNFKAAYDSTNYLIEKGHTRIGILTGPAQIHTSKERLAGYEAALAEAGIAINEKYIARTDFSLQGGYESMANLLAQEERVTAVFATNYEMTLGIILAANDMGVSIPGDVSVIGFDNLELARALKLTVVAQPLQEIGQHAAALLLERMQKKEEHPGKVVTLFTRIETGSSVTAPAE